MARVFCSILPTDAISRSLHAGDVLLIKGLMAPMVLGAEATLACASNGCGGGGEIKIHASVHFGAPRATIERSTRQLPQWMDLFATPAYAQSPENEMTKSAEAKVTMDAYGNIVNGAFKSVVSRWNTQFKATPSEGQTDLDITLTRSVGGFEALITGKGFISNFQFDSSIDIERKTHYEGKTTRQ